MGRLNRVARILMKAGGALSLASIALNGARISPLSFALLGVAMIGGVLIIVDGRLEKRRES